MEKRKFASIGILAFLLFSLFGSAFATVDVNITNDTAINGSLYAGGTNITIKWSADSNVGHIIQDVNIQDMNCSTGWETTQGTYANETDTNITGTQACTTDANAPTCAVMQRTVTIPNPTGQLGAMVRYYPAVRCNAVKTGVDTNSIASYSVLVNKDCAKVWTPYILGIIVVGILGAVAVFFMNRIGNLDPKLMAIIFIIIGATIALLILQTLNC